MTPPVGSVALIGFGEVGQIFGRALRARGIRDVRAFDIAFGKNESELQAARAAGIAAASSTSEAVAGAELTISAVTAAAAADAARAVAPHLDRRAFYLDLNSVAPETKRAAAAIIAEVGGAFVEAAVMASVPPAGIATPMLIGGPHAQRFSALAERLGFNATVFSDRVGPASSVKMCRSVMIKGIEALSMECLLAARHYGVEREVLLSLGDTLPDQDWFRLAHYLIGRSLRHGRRRAEEMREVARTVADAGVDPTMSLAIAERQDWAAARGDRLGAKTISQASLPELLSEVAKPARSARTEPAET